MNFWVLNLSSCSDADPYLTYLGRGAPLPLCHSVECIPQCLFSPDLLVSWHVPVPSWQWEFWFPNYTCEVPRGRKAMSFGIVGTFLATSPVTVKDTRVTGLRKATDFGTQLPSL